MTHKLTHVNRPLNEAERQQAAEVRAAAEHDFPPKPHDESVPPAGIPAQIASARGLTRYELSHLSGVPSVAVREIEQGGDMPVSQLCAVAAVLGLSIALVDQAV